MSRNSWVGVDLDGTLAHYDHWISEKHIGEPIPAMVDRVKRWLEKGIQVKILTARAIDLDVVQLIQEWCYKHIGQTLEVTNKKDFGMFELWDDRAVRVVKNTGMPCCKQYKGEDGYSSMRKYILVV